MGRNDGGIESALDIKNVRLHTLVRCLGSISSKNSTKNRTVMSPSRACSACLTSPS